MASVKATSSARPGVTLSGTNVTSNGFSINFPATTGTADETWNITYTDDNSCTATTTYTVEAPCVYTISCSPTSKQLQDGSASTVVKVSSSKSTCTELSFTVNNGTTKYSGSGTGHTFIATSAGTYTFKSVGDTSKTATFTVEEAPEECTYTCADFLNFSGHTVPANPTSAVEIFSFEVMKKTSGGKHNATAWYPDSHNFLLGTIQPGDWDSTTHTEELSDRWRYHIYLPANRIGQNTTTSQRTDIIYIRAYHCSDVTYRGKEGVTGMPSDVACSIVQMTIKQSAAAATCTVNSITVQSSEIELTGSSFSNKVTVNTTGNSCSKKWYGYQYDSTGEIPGTRQTGNTGGNFTGTTTGNFRVHAEDNTAKTAEFSVTAASSGVVLSITVNAAKDNNGYAYPWLMMTSPAPQEAYQGYIDGMLGAYPISIDINPNVWEDDGHGVYYCCGNFDIANVDFENVKNASWSGLEVKNSGSGGINTDSSQINGNPPREDGGPAECNNKWH